MASRSGALQLLSRLLSHVQASSSGVAPEGARAIASSAVTLRQMRPPLLPARPEDAPEGGERLDLVDRLLSTELMPRRHRTRLSRLGVVDEFQRFPGDTGSTEVQVALLTQKIKDLALHLQEHRKDHSSRRGLEAMLNQRRTLLQYLRRTKFEVYVQIISRLGLKDNYANQDRFTSRYKPAAR